MFWQIRIQGHLSEQWQGWFAGMRLENQADGSALLLGTLPDQAALYGVINHLRDTGLTLISVACFPETEKGS